MTDYIYLLQEREFINTNQNVYKLGRTRQNNLQRFKQYPKGSKLLLQQICNDCYTLEKKLISDFKNKYKYRKELGNEYFEGDYNDMIKDIYNKITNHNENTDEMDKPEIEIDEMDKPEIEIDEMDKPEIEIDDDVKILFPNYCDDESFGGRKQLIKIYIEVDKIFIKYIDYKINNWNDTPIHNYMVKEEVIDRNRWDNNCKYFSVKYKDNYYNKIIKNKVIENNKTYDLNDVRFIRRLDKYKHYIKLHYSDKLDYINDKYRLHFKEKFNLIEFYIQNNAILNDVIYCGLIKDVCYINFISDDGLEKLKDPNYQYNYIDNSFDKYSNTIVDLEIYIKTINNFGFDYDYLEKYTPYCININNDEYYMLNRDYKGITTDNAYTLMNYKQIWLWLHKGNQRPWNYDKEEEIKVLYKKLSETLKKTTTNKICLNENEHTNIILTKCI